jgi:Putative zinc-finger
MNCENVQSLLLAYLDGEVTPSERALILAHLSGCTVCQQELDLLSTARSRVRSALQHRAIQAMPPKDAWIRLEGRLTEAAQPSSKFSVWFSRKAPNASRTLNQLFGGVNMQKRSLVSAIAAVVLLAVLGTVIAKNVTPVSAEQVLDRAYEAQSAQSQGRGIQHTRIEFYQNICALPEDQGVTTVMENYADLEAGKFRLVSTNAKTGKVTDLFAFDGLHLYNSAFEHVAAEAKSPKKGSEPQPARFDCDLKGDGNDGLLTVYRGTQSGMVATIALKPLNADATDGMNEEIFQKMRDDPNTELLGRETWDDGRTVYVLRSEEPVKALIEDSTELPVGWVVSYFDAETYQLLGSRATLVNGGQERLVYSYRVLVDEILPAGSNVAWDLSDVEGITIVDDPDGEYVELLPEIISEGQLASYTSSAYLLSAIPDGFTLEISAAPNQPEDQTFTYVATYRNEAGDYFTIQTMGEKDPRFLSEGTDHTYITASGLTLHFLRTEAKRGVPSTSESSGETSSSDESSKKEFTAVIVETPDGTAFMINSSLPRETVEAWAEELVLVK